MSKSFRYVDFYWRLAGSEDRYLVGVATYVAGEGWNQGWCFFPRVSGRKPSRRFYLTWEECVPRWVGYPDRCETEMRDAAYL
jgi:hypothetical protein